MWPFDDNLRNQDGSNKYKEWLRRWLMGGWFRYVAAGTLVLVLVTSLVWAAVYTWGPMGVIRTMPELPAVEGINNEPVAPAETILDRLHETLESPGNGEQPPDSTAVEAPVELPAPTPEPAGNPGTSGPADKSVPEPGPEQPSGTTAGGILKGSMEKPLTGQLVAGYGLAYSERFGDYRFNPGLELMAEAGTAVKAALDGHVKAVIHEPYGGYTVVLDHGAGWTSTYTSLETVKVGESQTVETGTLLGLLQACDHDGLEGRLNFSMAQHGEPVDPGPYLLD